MTSLDLNINSSSSGQSVCLSVSQLVTNSDPYHKLLFLSTDKTTIHVRHRFSIPLPHQSLKLNIQDTLICFDIILQVTDEEFASSGKKIAVRCMPFPPKLIRFVAHSDVSPSDIEEGIDKVKYVLDELKSSESNLQEAVA